MSRLVDSAASVCYFMAALLIAFALTAWQLSGDLVQSLRNIWGKP